jgi:hypothetical protein
METNKLNPYYDRTEIQINNGEINMLEYMRGLFLNKIGYDELNVSYMYKRGKMKNIIRFFVHRIENIKNGEFFVECQYMAFYLKNAEINHLWNNAHINFVAHFQAQHKSHVEYSQKIYDVRLMIENSIK